MCSATIVYAVLLCYVCVAQFALQQIRGARFVYLVYRTVELLAASQSYDLDETFGVNVKFPE